VLIAAVKLGVNFRGIGHELPRVLHVRMGEQCEVRGLFVSAVRIVLGGAFAVAGGGAEMRRRLAVMIGGLMSGAPRLGLASHLLWLRIWAARVAGASNKNAGSVPIRGATRHYGLPN
jgi:hypothetical protein